VKPVVLPPNQFPHFYRGGRRIERLRGLDARAENMPEDWLASTTTRFGEDRQGLSALPDGQLLRDAVAHDPLPWLGPEHIAAFGPDVDLLVKLLDAGQRLVVHVHPNDKFAARHLGCRHGKTESWVIVETEVEQALVYLGFREPVDDDVMRGWVDGQDVDAMLGALNVLPVKAGDAILVPAGLPHAIGEGVLIVELQEPTDFSILMEWKGFDLDGVAEGHLGLGFDIALQCVDRQAWSTQQLDQLRGPIDDGSLARVSLLPAAADPFFRAERLREGARLEPAFSVLIATDGSGTLRTQDGGDLSISRGDAVVLPYGAGPSVIEGGVELIRCLPPHPQSLGSL
jgi:mannose-6-phosphate isomerase